MANPFRYGRVVEGDAFFDRQRTKGDIKNVLEGRNNVVLYGPRRYGKSSLVGEVLRDLRAEGVLCAQINLMDVSSLEDFIVKYAKSVYREVSAVAGALNKLAQIFRCLSPAIGFDEEGRPELRLQIAPLRADTTLLREVLELPERLCPNGRRMVIALDEFQEVEGLGIKTDFERTMRTVVEAQKKVSYVFLGSKTHLMRRMFASKSRPFYNAAQKFELQKPPRNESAAFLVRRFGDVGIRLSQVLADDMVERVANVPYYLQALGSWTYHAVVDRQGDRVLQNDVEESFESLYEAERILLENTFVTHSASQRMLLRALAQEPTTRFDEQYRSRHALASTSTVNTSLRRLIAESTVENVEGAYSIIDPLLAYHLTR